jgi:hypothetical protein
MPIFSAHKYTDHVGELMLSEHAYPTSLFFSILVFCVILLGPVWSLKKLDIRKTAQLMFAVYLIHLNPWTTTYIWNGIFQSKWAFNNLPIVAFLIYTIIEIFLIFIVSAIIAKVQKRLLPKI